MHNHHSKEYSRETKAEILDALAIDDVQHAIMGIFS